MLVLMRSTIASWLNILQNHARQKQAELAQTPPQRRRTSNVAHARSWRASTRRSRTWRASSGPPSTCRIDLFGPEPNDTHTATGRVSSCADRAGGIDHFSFFSPRAVSRPEASLDTSRARAPCGEGAAFSVFRPLFAKGGGPISGGLASPPYARRAGAED